MAVCAIILTLKHSRLLIVSTLTTNDSSVVNSVKVVFNMSLTNFDTVNGLSYFAQMSAFSNNGSEPFGQFNSCALLVVLTSPQLACWYTVKKLKFLPP